MRTFLLVPIVYAAAVLQTSLADLLRVGYATPDLLALAAVVWILVTPGRRTFLLAGAIGLASDAISPGRLGVAVAAFLLVGYGLTRLRTRFAPEHLPAQLLAVGLATTLLAVSQAIACRLLGETSLPLATLLVRALGVGAYTTGVGLPVLMVVGWVREPFRARRRRLEGA